MISAKARVTDCGYEVEPYDLSSEAPAMPRKVEKVKHDEAAPSDSTARLKTQEEK